jgi:DNA-binding Lrp family transcriptional regulator
MDDHGVPSRAHDAPGGRSAHLGERDRRLLEFAARHRLVLAAQVATLLGVSAPTARNRLHRLSRAGYLRSVRELSGPGCYLIERRGLDAVGSRLPAARSINRAEYEHDVGLGWLWLAAQRGVFGRLAAVVSERQMRSHATRRDRQTDPLGVRLGGVGPRGDERLHYPDLWLQCATGHRIAVELELTGKSRLRREAILGGYAVDARVDLVLYLVAERSVGKAIERAAARTGVSSLVRVQMICLDPPARATAGRAASRRRSRTAGTAAASPATRTGATEVER